MPVTEGFYNLELLPLPSFLVEKMLTHAVLHTSEHFTNLKKYATHVYHTDLYTKALTLPMLRLLSSKAQGS